MVAEAGRSESSKRGWPIRWLMLLIPLVLVLVILAWSWWWIGGIRFSNPLPEMHSEIEQFVPPEGSTLISVDEYGFDRFCFLVCSGPTVEARFSLPDVSDEEKCSLVERAMREWLGTAELFPGRAAVACYVGAATWSEHPGWDPAALVFEEPGSDGSDLSVLISEP